MLGKVLVTILFTRNHFKGYQGQLTLFKLVFAFLITATAVYESLSVNGYGMRCFRVAKSKVPAE